MVDTDHRRGEDQRWERVKSTGKMIRIVIAGEGRVGIGW